ncbi:MAG: hypothetical protein C0483_04685 [Pirellula sp.]|nr:hypothetical protein [Pirellula sp.]
MSDTPEFSGDDLNGVELHAKKLAIRVALKIINDLVDSLEAVRIEGDEAFVKGAAKGIQTAVQLAEDYGSMLRKME